MGENEGSASCLEHLELRLSTPLLTPVPLSWPARPSWWTTLCGCCGTLPQMQWLKATLEIRLVQIGGRGWVLWKVPGRMCPASSRL